MGVQNDSNFEGSVFEKSLNFHNKDKSIDDKLKELPKSDGAWQKCIDDNIVPTNPVYTGEAKEEPKTVKRPSKPEYYLNIASVVATRSTCIRRKFGAVIVKDDTIISTGYAGAPRGRENCCSRGECFRMENNIPAGTRYEVCRSVHAEMNAIINADPIKRKGATMYLVGLENDGSYTEADCCSMCKRMVINSGITKMVFRTKDKGVRTVVVNEWIANDDSLTIHEGY